MASDPIKWRPPTKQQRFNMFRSLGLAAGPLTSDELIRKIEERYGSIFNLSGVPYEQRLARMKRATLGELLRGFDATIEGQRVRIVPSVVKREPTGLIGLDGKPIYQTLRVWVSLADLLMRATDGEQALTKLQDAVDVIVKNKDAMRRGLTVDIDGVQYMVKRVGEGLVFQPSMFGLDEKSA